MKPLIFLFLSLLCALPLIGQTLENQNFEQIDTVSLSGMKGWRANGAGKVGPDQNILHSGQAAIRIRNAKGQNFSSFSQMLPLNPSISLRKYRVSGYLKRDSVERFTGIWLNVYSGEQSIFFDNMSSRTLNGSADWTELSTDFLADETATEVQIGGLLVGGGSAWFDDFSITEIPLPADNLPDTLRNYISEALDLMQGNALYRDSVDWAKVRERASLISAGATSYADCYPAIRYALGKLGDRHSFLMDASASQKWAELTPDALKKRPLTTGEILDGKFACVRMPAFSSGSDAANTFFADQLHHLLDSLDRLGPQGWILDLRGNGGGNCWPMLAGIGPLLGEGACGYFLVPGGKDSDAWYYRDGKSGIGKEVLAQVSRKPYKMKQKRTPVAVLTGPRTASSGEVVAVAFRKRPHTRSFGEPTAGLSTGNQNFTLRDGAQILLTTSIYADREREVYGAQVMPDELVSPATPTSGGPDPILEAAQKWLSQQRRVRKQP